MLLRDEPDALTVLTAGREGLARLGYGLDVARTGCFVAAAGLRAGRRRAVRTIAEETLETLTVNRIRGWDVFASRLLERIRGGGDDELTSTEGEIAVRVADGQRNREIANSLFVSESTVEAHLTRIYRKLGLRNRADLSRWVGAPALREPSRAPAL